MSAALSGFWSHSFRSYNDALLDRRSVKGPIADDIASLLMFLGFAVFQFRLFKNLISYRCQSGEKCTENKGSRRFAQVSAFLFVLYILSGIVFTAVFVIKMIKAPVPYVVVTTVIPEEPIGLYCRFLRSGGKHVWVEGQHVGGWRWTETMEWNCLPSTEALKPIFLLETVGGSLLQALTLTGDALLMYRCYIVFSDRPAVHRVGWLVFLTSFVLSAVYIVYYVTQGYSWDNPEPTSLPTGFALHHAAAVYIACSTAANLYVTITISARIIDAKRRLDRLELTQPIVDSIQDSTSTGSAHETAIMILVEAALPASLVGILLSIMTVPVGNLELRGTAVNPRSFRVLWVSLMAIAPQVIAIRVAEGRSWRTSQTELVSRPIAFTEGNARQSAMVLSERFSRASNS